MAESTLLRSSQRMEGEKIERLRERILQCPICMDEYQDPRILPCHHTVCLTCLLDFVRHSSSSGRLFRCPQCRADVCVPRGGVKEFPPNFYVNCIQDELGNKPYFGTCDVCERDWIVSQFQCIDCDLDICRFCIHDHRLFKHSPESVPTIIRIEAGNIGIHMSSQRNCEIHPEEQPHMFCCTCAKSVCVTCVCESHKRHETLPLIKKLHTEQKNLQFDLDHLQTETGQVRKVLDKLNIFEQKTQLKTEETVKEMREQARVITNAIDKMADERVYRVARDRDTRLKEVAAYRKELSHFLDQLKKGESFLEDLQDGDICLELLESFSKYKQILSLTRKSVVNREIDESQFSFVPGKCFEKFGYLGVKFGTVQRDEKQVLLLEQDGLKTWNLKKNIIRLLNPWNIVGICMLLFVVVGLTNLCLSLSVEEDHFVITEKIIVLLMGTCLLFASVFAYKKS